MSVDANAEREITPKSISVLCHCQNVKCKIAILPPEPEKMNYCEKRKLKVKISCDEKDLSCFDAMCLCFQYFEQFSEIIQDFSRI